MTTDTNTNGQTQALSPYQARAIELREEISQDATPRAIVPRTFAEAQAFAAALAHSDLVPRDLRDKAPNILIVVLAGAELGFPPVRSLSLFHVMEGVPKLSSEGLGAIVTASPLCEYLEPREVSNERVVFAAKRRGRPEITLAYTDADVKLANLDRKTSSGKESNHVKFPRQMKTARCRSEIAKLVWPDLAAGIQTAEEAHEVAFIRELEGPPPQSAAFSAPGPLPTPAAKAPSAKSTSKGKPIDTTATEGPKVASNPPPNAGSHVGEPPARPTMGAPDPAAADALAKAREAKAAIDAQGRRVAAEIASHGPVTDRDPVIVTPEAGTDNSTAAGELGPNTRDEAPTQTGEDRAPAATAEDDFGGDAQPTTLPERTFAAFEKELRAVVEAKDGNGLRRIKEEWGPWSRDQGEGGGFAFAYKMRDAFAKAKADMGIK